MAKHDALIDIAEQQQQQQAGHQKMGRGAYHNLWLIRALVFLGVFLAPVRRSWTT